MYRFEITFLFWRVLFGHFNCVLFGDLELKRRICLRFLKTAPDSSFHNITLSIWMNVKQAPDKSSPVNLNKAKIAKKLWAYGDKSTANGKLGSYKITRGSFFSWDHSWKDHQNVVYNSCRVLLPVVFWWQKTPQLLQFSITHLES